MSGVMSVGDEVRALERLDLEGLRAEWRRRFGAPPGVRSHDLLRRLLSWHIQVRVYGGLDAETRKLLRQASATPRGPKLQVGARIAREWKGVRYEVEVVEAGFLYAGSQYDSLSEIARTITGARWNGPRFFGLRQDARP
jgi:hypothetical protein